jgi:hypothetical protein
MSSRLASNEHHIAYPRDASTKANLGLKTFLNGWPARTPVRRKKIGTVGGARLDLLHSPGERCYPSISGESCRVGT